MTEEFGVFLVANDPVRAIGLRRRFVIKKPEWSAAENNKQFAAAKAELRRCATSSPIQCAPE